MQIELLERLKSNSLIISVRWNEPSISGDEMINVCVDLMDDEVATALESEEGRPLVIPDRVRAVAVAQAQMLASALAGLYKELERS